MACEDDGNLSHQFTLPIFCHMVVAQNDPKPDLRAQPLSYTCRLQGLLSKRRHEMALVSTYLVTLQVVRRQAYQHLQCLALSRNLLQGKRLSMLVSFCGRGDAGEPHISTPVS